jgi:hypothetical protein
MEESLGNAELFWQYVAKNIHFGALPYVIPNQI